MLVKTFEQQVCKHPNNIAVKTASGEITYDTLNRNSNRIACHIMSQIIDDKYEVSYVQADDSNNLIYTKTRAILLFEHGVDMITGTVSAVKAGVTYVPFDPTYPENRLIYMLKDCEASLLITNSKNWNLAQRLSEHGITEVDIINIDDCGDSISDENLGYYSDDKNLAYILYTSGSTGNPKGVMQSYRNVEYFIRNYIKDMKITSADKMTLFSSFSHDAAIMDIYSALLSGATLYPLNIREQINIDELNEWLIDQGITIWHSVPTLYRYYINTLKSKDKYPALKFIVLGGESVLKHDIEMSQKYFENTIFVNLYGQSESSYNSSLHISPIENIKGMTLGKVIDGTEIYVVDEEGEEVAPLRVGEILIVSPYISLGYWKDAERTSSAFGNDADLGSLYWTGDLGRLLKDGSIEFAGRKDLQIKIRGYRVELGEIESKLLNHDAVKEAAVMAKMDSDGNNFLCAYIAGTDIKAISDELREYLGKELPDYMIPSYFIPLEKLPLTPNGKLDREVLSKLGTSINSGVEYEAPRNTMEEKLVNICQEVLGVEQIGINDSFFELGGHSLKAASLVAKIHKALNVEVPLKEIFINPTIKGMAEYIKISKESIYLSIESIEEKEYYQMSSAQKRVYTLQQLDINSTSYNITRVLELVGDLDVDRLKEVFNKLIQRHESLRTSFEALEEGLLQKVHKQVEFEIEEYEADEEKEIEKNVKDFIRVFDLSKAPLLRVGLVKVKSNKHILMYDIHHIISDGTSMGILVEEFSKAYAGEEIKPLRLQYKDFSEWQNNMYSSEKINEQEEYWLKQFEGEIPVLNLTTDYQRPALQSFEGASIQFEIKEELTNKLKQMAKATGSTMYMVLLSTFNILLSKYSGQEDIVVGSPIAGRPHADLENIIGMFVNTLAMRNYPNGEKTFVDFLREVKNNALGAYENQDYQFEELVEKLAVARDFSRNPVFDVMLVLQNMDIAEVKVEDLKISPYKSENMVSKFDITLTAVELENSISIGIQYCTKLFSRATIMRMYKHLENIIQAVTENIDIKLSEVEILTAEEKQKILIDFNNTKADYPKNKTIQQLFEEQVERTPNNIAVLYEDKQLTYRELNEKANQLAGVLRNKGVVADSIVGIMANRSLEMVIGIIGILKAGGAYLPIDPYYPKERVDYMLQDSGAKLLLIQKHLKDCVSNSIDTISIDEASIYEGDNKNLEIITELNNLAYVIYTSGSTGKPKGVMIEHRNINNSICSLMKEYRLCQNDSILHVISFAFDGFVTTLFTPILSGAKVVFMKDEDSKNPISIKEHINRYGITRFTSVPTLYSALLEASDKEDLETLRIVTLAGENTSESLIKKSKNIMPNVEIINEYGPTENSVVTTISRDIQAGKKVTIGKPIANTKVYIVDKNNKLQPIGVPGELCIAGEGLARGYLNNLELTVEKFVDSPFELETRMYHTGDLATWLPDGNIEYLGRIDHQVKIRGFRVELGEIENKLLSHEAIKESVVIARDDKSENKYLCAYVVGEKELTVLELREHLSKDLPDYMIPLYFIQLNKLPLTSNGKIDKKALPEPDGSISTGTEYEAPRNSTEEKLVKVWEDVLGIERVGINDNFFALGGDSIKAIQVAARMQKYQLKLEVKYIIKNPTIKEQSRYVVKNSRKAEQGLVTGEIELTPIQRWFLDTNFTDKHHWNQSVMLYREEGFYEEALTKAFDKLVEHHDILRTVYEEKQGNIRQINREKDGDFFTLEVFDLTHIDNKEDIAAKIKEKANNIQGSIDLVNGSLIKLGLFKTKHGDHLLIVIHHLVVDGVSWRIIFEDLSIAYKQAINGERIVLQEKTDSFKLWSEELRKYANSSKLIKELPYWRKIQESDISAIPKDLDFDSYISNDKRTISIDFTEKETEQLIKQVNRAYGTEINDILLTALGAAIKEWSGNEKVLIDLEGHGRELKLADVDISRTVGWFTSTYPVILDMTGIRDRGYQIKKTKESLRHIPNKGIGYGILKYLTKPENREGVSFNRNAEISFNYLGQFDNDVNTEVFKASNMPLGNSVSLRSEKTYSIDISGIITGGRLVLGFSYNKNEYAEETIKKITEIYSNNLREIIEHCIEKEATEITPSDTRAKNMSLEELDSLIETLGKSGIERKAIEDIYPLSPVQEGMLFHALLDKNSHAYFEQTVLKIEGELDIDVFEKSLNNIIQKHEVLRTSFVYEGIGKPVQVVLSKRKANISYEDITSIEQERKAEYIEQLKEADRENSFDLTKDTLIRATIIKEAETKYHIVWSFHHIIMDGWCLSLIMKDFFESYSLIKAGNTIDIGKSEAYGSFIEWLEQQEKENAIKYWEEYLEGYEQQAAIPLKITTVDREVNRTDVVQIVLNEELTEGLVKIAQNSGVTLNTVVQAMWGILLQKYNNVEDVVFGAVVSGRPEEIKGIEEIVGLFINTIPVRIKQDKQSTFKELIKELQNKSIEASKYDYMPLAEIQSNSELRQNLFDHIMVFENYPVEKEVQAQSRERNIGFNIRNVEVYEQTNYDFGVVVIPGKEIALKLTYNTSVYEEENIRKIEGHFTQIAESVVEDAEVKISEVEILTEEERQQILIDFNNTAVDYTNDKAIYQLFEEQVERSPDSIALMYEDRSLTYRELNERANQLARVLRNIGVKSDNIIGIMVERSLEMIVGIIGILKAGCAYLPIDPEYPQDRIEYMLQDSGARILLTQSALSNRIVLKQEVLILDDSTLYKGDNTNLDKVNKSNDLAYIIYTSGSTGKPKGVMIEHRNVYNSIYSRMKEYELGQKDNVLQLFSFAFDGFVTSFFTPILSGSRVILMKDEDSKNPICIKEHIKRYGITHFITVPSLYSAILECSDKKELETLRIITLAGENTSESLIKQSKAIKPDLEIVNEYGPTENSVVTTILRDMKIGKKVTIGKPIANTKVYILDKNSKLQPTGVAGELCIAGAGLARGYLNRPELTTEKYVDNPFKLGDRMYHTGDLARWLPDGNIEFLGRIDNQVKIRGYRIELGEIENKLLSHEAVKETVIISRDDNDGSKYLCAYVVGDKELTVLELREHLSKDLPDYMIPSYFIQLEKLPLTSNGKVDRKALPEHDGSVNSGVEYIAPRNEIEKKLVSIWQEVLGIESIGISDNFFALGGDSIKSIQISARMQKYQLKLEVKYIMQNPTIKELSKYVVKNSRKAEQDLVTGEIELTPIQRWFFDTNFTDKHHWNQSVMLYREDGFYEEALTKAFDKLVEHHDILRTVYEEKQGNIKQINREKDGDFFTLEVIDLTHIDNKEDIAEKIKEKANNIQRSIDLSNGPLIKLGLFKTKHGDHLLIVIHHLVVDGVSWRIIFEDLDIAYKQAINSERIVLQDKTDSFKLWSEELRKYANSSKLLKELPYWRKIEESDISAIPKDLDSDSYISNDKRTISIDFTEKETEQLIKQVNRAYGTEINDILLTALGTTIKEWSGNEKVLIDLEGHGRELKLEDVDISRTVGWFTSTYPVILDMTGIRDRGYQIKKTKESLRHIPNKGIGYGILKYLTKPENREGISFNRYAEISFNYLGQFDNDVNTEVFKASNMPLGNSVSLRSEKTYSIDISGIITGGRLGLGFSYNKNEYAEETIKKITEIYSCELREIIEHCIEKEATEITPCDTRAKNMSLEELDSLIETLGKSEIDKKTIEDIYPLSPMQEGMLFHALLDKNSHAYFEQTVLEIEGELDIDVFEKSLNNIIQKHEVLRTAFVYEGIGKPVQVVLSKRKANISYEDITSIEQERKAEYIEQLKEADRENSFDLTKDTLIRATIIKEAERKYHIVWSFHHIIMDGWCLSLIMKDFFKSYSSIKTGNTVDIGKSEAYGSFIEWLEEQEKKDAARYWEKYLEGYEQQTAIPLKRTTVDRELNRTKVVQFVLKKELTEGLVKVAQNSGVTLNTVVQAMWGMLLQKYNNVEDVVFGAVVSGRPEEIKGIEEIVGLFINTIPVRVRQDKQSTFKELIKELQNKSIEASKYDYMPLAEIQSNSELKQNLFDHIMVFENYPVEKEVQAQSRERNIGFKIKNVEVYEQTNYDFGVVVIPGKEIALKLTYNTSVYEEENIRKIEGHFKSIADKVVEDAEVKISEVEILTEEERQQILIDFNNTKIDYPKDKTIHQLFEEQVERTPDNIAVVYEDRSLTYRELNEKANQLARVLRGKGVSTDNIVGIMVERSLEMIVGIIGILKVGCAYLPIDPEYPQGRIEYMLQDSGARILLTQSALSNRIVLNQEVFILILDDNMLYTGDNTNLDKVNKSNDLAYIIYTSGSTGKPKGVMIEHRNVYNSIYSRMREYELGHKDNVLQLFSFAFDGFVTSFFTPILSGSRVILMKDEDSKNPVSIKEYIKRYGITHFITVPSLYSAILECSDKEELETLRIVTLAGENTSESLIKQSKSIKPDLEIVNEYGPTENSVVTTISRDMKIGKKVTIGKPIANTKVYILDKNSKLQPTGVAGELCIAGAGLARGYLNRPELTTEKYVDNPFKLGEKMYHTGDLARWLPDGNIEFLGRIDNQVKIRGYRIELGEIENKLLSHEAVKETVVIARDDDRGSKYLCAYVVGDKELTVLELREHLSKDLPDYMIPSYFIQLEKLPLTPNGKVDRKALPEPDGSINSGVEYIAPESEVEEKLAAIWQEILGIEKVGLNDNFFSLGGDSIKAIQVTSRLYQYNMKLDIKQIIQNQTISKISKYVEHISYKSSQEIVTGETKLTPIQKWFFECNFTDKHHWNQAISLNAIKGFDESIINKVFTKILEHHDVLRATYEINRQEARQIIKPINEHMYDFEVYDFRNKSDYLDCIKSKSSEVQASINLEEGPLVKLALFKTIEGDYLLIAIHHLAVDGVSWRIIMEDFAAGYNQCLNNQNIEFQLKTDSYKAWVEMLNSYSSSDEISKEIEYWTALENSNVVPLSDSISDYLVTKDSLTVSYKLKDIESVSIEFNEEQTEKLLKEVNSTYNTEINDILLCALGCALKKWTGNTSILVELEGHGREENIGNINIKRTVGWFTSTYPVILDMSKSDSISYQIRNIKESLRQIPNKGIGYRILKYLTPVEKKQKLSFNLKPEISFNYLGQFEENEATGIFNMSGISSGNSMSLESEKINLIDINGMISQNKMILSFSYSNKQLTRDSILKLAEYYKKHLADIIEHCTNAKGNVLTPSDITLQGINIEQLGEIYDILRNK